MFLLAVLYKVVPKGDGAKDCVHSGWAWLFLFMSPQWQLMLKVREGGVCWNLLEDCFLLTAPWCCSRLCSACEERSPWGAEARTWGPRLCTDNVPLSSPPPNIRCKWLPIKICLLHQDSCRKAVESEAYGFVGLERKLSLLIFASALFQSHTEGRSYLLVTKEVLTRPWVIPARPVQIKVCRAQSCKN